MLGIKEREWDLQRNEFIVPCKSTEKAGKLDEIRAPKRGKKKQQQQRERQRSVSEWVQYLSILQSGRVYLDKCEVKSRATHNNKPRRLLQIKKTSPEQDQKG